MSGDGRYCCKTRRRTCPAQQWNPDRACNALKLHRQMLRRINVARCTHKNTFATVSALLRHAEPREGRPLSSWNRISAHQRDQSPFMSSRPSCAAFRSLMCPREIHGDYVLDYTRIKNPAKSLDSGLDLVGKGSIGWCARRRRTRSNEPPTDDGGPRTAGLGWWELQ